MVLIDTSVWIDFFQKPDAKDNERLEALIKGVNRAAVCGIVLQEVLQGIRDDNVHQKVKSRLVLMPFFNADKEVWLEAAAVYRLLRKKGISIPPVDVSVAAIALRYGLPLYSHDRHFKSIAAHTPLVLF